MKHVLYIFLLISLLTTSGCGYFGSGGPVAINTFEILNRISVNMDSVKYMATVVHAHSDEYNDEQKKRLVQAQGTLLSVLSYVEGLAMSGKANYGNVSAAWDMSKTEYIELVRIIDTSTWEEADRHLYTSIKGEAQRLANMVEASLQIAEEEASRQELEAIISQIKSVAGLFAGII